MELQLEDKVVVITGGASGIGKACAMTYLEEGCKVAVCGRSQSRLDSFAQECREAGYTNFFTINADVTDPADRQSILDQTLARFAGLHIWINNAGAVIRNKLMEASLKEWDTIMNTNLQATFACTKLAAGHMKDHGGGVIVNASSFASRIPFAGTGIYAASKWGVNALTQVFAAELAPYGIRVFAYIPGIIVSELTRDRITANKDALLQQIPLNRLGEPEDMAPTIVFLTSDRANYFTGVTVEITGGKCCVQNPLFGWETAAQ